MQNHNIFLILKKIGLKLKSLSISEIRTWSSFENLVADYFREVQKDKEFNVKNVVVNPTGSGMDGGRDILVTLTVDDSIITFHRKWVIQCKFYSTDVKKSNLADINLPSLIHEYGANGYLLVCKNGVTSGLSTSFEALNLNCKFGYKYEFWNQSQLLKRILYKRELIDAYFPKYSQFLKKEALKIKEMK
jgi:hypothetical protein